MLIVINSQTEPYKYNPFCDLILRIMCQVNNLLNLLNFKGGVQKGRQFLSSGQTSLGHSTPSTVQLFWAPPSPPLTYFAFLLPFKRMSFLTLCSLLCLVATSSWFFRWGKAFPFSLFSMDFVHISCWQTSQGFKTLARCGHYILWQARRRQDRQDQRPEEEPAENLFAKFVGFGS